MIVVWTVKNGAPPRVKGYVEQVEDALARAWIKRGICKPYRDVMEKRAAGTAPPGTRTRAVSRSKRG